MIEYRTIEGAPADRLYFVCRPLVATLSTDACADNWRRAQDSDDGSLWRCRNCVVGAEHAGETAANLWYGRGQLICSRCHRGVARLIYDEWCVSCYNRQREYLVGRNARGAFPSRMRPLAKRVMRIMAGGHPAEVRRPLSADTAELIVSVLRDSREKIVFHFWGGPQASKLRQLPLF